MKHFIIFLLSFSAQSYEHMIVKGYSSCIACHKSSTGGGLLSEYGKYISDSSSMISSKDFSVSKSKLDYALQFRYAQVNANGSKRKFPMQADLLTNVDFKDKGQVFVDIARAPESQAIASGIEEPKQSDLWFFRKLMYEYKDFFVGRERLNLGLNLVDHTVLNKDLNRMDVSDLTTNIGMKSVSKTGSFRAFIFVPSFQENTNNRESGLAFEYRRFINSSFNLGVFSFLSKGKTIDRESIGINMKGSYSIFTLLYEGIYSHRTFKDESTLDQSTNFIRLSVLPHLSTLFFINYELANRNKTFSLDENRFGFGTRLRVWKWVSLQYDQKKIKRNNVDENVSIAQVYLNLWR